MSNPPLVLPPVNNEPISTRSQEAKERSKPQQTQEKKVRFENTERRSNFQRRFKGRMAPAGSVYWVAQRLVEETTDKAIGLLKLWVEPKQLAEATEETIALINDLSDVDAIRALQQLQQPKRYVQRTKTNSQQLDLQVDIHTLDDQ